MNETRPVCGTTPNSKFYLQIYHPTNRHPQTPLVQKKRLLPQVGTFLTSWVTQSGGPCRRHFGRAAKAPAC